MLSSIPVNSPTTNEMTFQSSPLYVLFSCCSQKYSRHLQFKPNNSSLSSSPVEISAPHSIFPSVPDKIQTSSASAAATTIKSKPKLRLAYIGPQVTTSDSDNEADATFATLSRADQMAAYEKFKRDTRIQKIYEFHQQAAQFDIQLADNISNTPSDKSGIAIARLMTQHEQTMLRLRTDKEEERRKLVRDERNRMTVEIKKGAGLNKKVSSFSQTTIPVVPVPTKPPTPPLSSSYPGIMDFNQLQSVLEYAPDMSLDAALGITQLISSDSHQAAHDGHTYSGPRQRKDSISILDHTPPSAPKANSAPLLLLLLILLPPPPPPPAAP